jgi:hypothetical protein
MMTRAQLDDLIRTVESNAAYAKSTRDGFQLRGPAWKASHKQFKAQLRLLNLLESIRDTQTTADGKIAIPGDKVWHLTRDKSEIKADIVDTPFTMKNGRQIHCTYSSEAALKRAMAKAKKETSND